MYLESQDKILKIVNQLSMKALAPSKLEKQKVSLYLKFFNNDTVNGLRFLSFRKNKPEYLHTALFIEIMTE